METLFYIVLLLAIVDIILCVYLILGLKPSIVATAILLIMFTASYLVGGGIELFIKMVGISLVAIFLISGFLASMVRPSMYCNDKETTWKS